MNTRPLFTIHIGYGKTGTTALQNFFKTNRSILISQGILYPDFFYYGIPQNITDHNIMGYALIGNSNWLRLSIEDCFEQIKKQIVKNSGIHTVLISGETLLGIPEPHHFENENDYWLSNEQKVARFKDLLSEYSCRIIAYVRRQDEWLDAALNQSIKFEGLSRRPPETDVERYISQTAPRLDYYRQLSLWAKYFGRDAITARLYNRDLLKNGDIVADFIENSGLPIDAPYIKPEISIESSNESLCRDVLEFKRILNHIPREKENERALAKKLRMISKEMTRNNPLNDSTLLSYDDRKNILEDCKNNNKLLVAEYMADIPDALQLLTTIPGEKVDTPGVSDYPGLNTGKLIEISHRLEEPRLYGNQIYFILGVGKYFRTKIPFLYALLIYVRNLFRK